MASALVTGVAGFIGSHLAVRLLDEGHRVRGVDNFDPYYDRTLKEENLAAVGDRRGFAFREADLCTTDTAALLADVDWVFHLAARPGVRRSWGVDFEAYAAANVVATQRLLEGLRAHPVERMVFASSSSVYGEGGGQPAREDAPRRPLSPYGVTKLACEALVGAYVTGYGLPIISLRYFTVFGPRQRPDMAFHRFARAIALGETLEVFGDGRQTRDFTYVDDVVTANLLAIRAGRPGSVYNIGGGAPARLLDAIGLMERIAGRPARVHWGPRQTGDPLATAADTSRARDELGFRPRVGLEEGLRHMMHWMSARGPSPSEDGDSA